MTLRKIHSPKMEHITGDWVKWYNELVHDFLESSFNIIRVIKEQIKKNEMRGGGGRMRQVLERGAVDAGILVGKSKRKRPLQITW